MRNQSSASIIGTHGRRGTTDKAASQSSVRATLDSASVAGVSSRIHSPSGRQISTPLRRKTGSGVAFHPNFGSFLQRGAGIHASSAQVGRYRRPRNRRPASEKRCSPLGRCVAKSLRRPAGSARRGNLTLGSSAGGATARAASGRLGSHYTSPSSESTSARDSTFNRGRISRRTGPALSPATCRRRGAAAGRMRLVIAPVTRAAIA